jgi:hypothetical protein
VRVVHVDWRWTVAAIDPVGGAAVAIKSPRSLEEALSLALELRRERQEVLRIADPLGFLIPLNAIDLYAKLRDADEDAPRAARIISLREATGCAGRR